MSILQIAITAFLVFAIVVTGLIGVYEISRSYYYKYKLRKVVNSFCEEYFKLFEQNLGELIANALADKDSYVQYQIKKEEICFLFRNKLFLFPFTARVSEALRVRGYDVRRVEPHKHSMYVLLKKEG